MKAIVIASALLVLAGQASADPSVRRRAPTGIGLACPTVAIQHAASLEIDAVETALLTDDADEREAALAAFGSTDATDMRWLSLLCAVHEIAGRSNLRFTVSERLKPGDTARVGALRDRSEAWLSAHAHDKIATRRPAREAPIPTARNKAEVVGCPPGTYLRVVPTAPPKDYCLAPDGKQYERDYWTVQRAKGAK